MFRISPIQVRRGINHALVFSFLLGTAGAAQAATPVGGMIDYNRDIRRVLSENCIRCHGPDEKDRTGGEKDKGGLRLDTRAGAVAVLDDHAAIVPGSPDKSELYLRIATEDENDIMPPLDTGKKLTAHEKDLIKTWITQGAPYAEHWSYVPPVRPAVPTVSNPKWPANPIDAFILARLDQE